MTGAPAQTWRKFRFASPPQWAYALYVLILLGVIGLLIAAAVLAGVSQRASGHLPLTRASSRLVGLAMWVPVFLIVAALVLWTIVPIAAGFNFDSADTNAAAIAGLIYLVGAVLLISGLVGRLVVMPLVTPRAKVIVQPGYYDKLVEIRNVHPAFVAAVNQAQQARAAQYAAANAAQNPPLPPYGSP
jgi:UPF0716 family protein affecting phage T7 exclusion